MKKVVVVDDNKSFAELERMLIETYNDAKCMVFVNSNEAYKYMARERNIDILVTDYEMPCMNGFELASKILAQNLTVRIIVVSGHDEVYLQSVKKQYNLGDKIEVICKSNISFLKSLV